MGSKESRNFTLGCIAKRRDGAMVFSSNGKTKIPAPSAHAEARVLRKAGRGATIWVSRVLHDGAWALAKPCKKCQALIRSYGVERVYYTIGPGEWGIWNPQANKVPPLNDV